LPNWIIKLLSAKGAPTRIREFLVTIKSDRRPFDFEQIIPVPEVIQHAASGYTIIDGQEVEQWYMIDDTHRRLFTPEEEKIVEGLGCRSWFDWSIANWGTCRNACDIELDNRTADVGYVTINFETAWSPPYPILKRLQELFPDIVFDFDWYDFDWDVEERLGFRGEISPS
jgi:Ferredoxin-like domain in Api92-like protein